MPEIVICDRINGSANLAVISAMALNNTVSGRFRRISLLHRKTPTSSMLEKWVSMANSIKQRASV
ncbi:hypothetical protein D3C79_809330 [compost metagenome]